MKPAICFILAVVALLVPALGRSEPYAFVGTGLQRTNAAGFSEVGMPLSVGLGFRINKAIAIEAAYTDMDATGHTKDSSSSSNVSTGRFTQVVKQEWKGTGTGVYLVGFHPVSPAVSMIGRIGASRLKGETKTSESVQFLSNTVGVPSTNTQTDTTTTERIWAPSIALGLQWTTGERVSLRGMFEHVSGRHGDFKSANALSVSVLYSF